VEHTVGVTVALTGGIGAGKTAVTDLLAARGAVVVDADEVARLVVEPGEPALQEIAEAFGPDMIGPDGRLRRQALAAAVFPDPQQLARLNAITHPRIEERTRELLRSAAEGAVVVYAMPLLVENGQAGRGWDLVVVVDAPDEVRLQRLVAGRGLSADDARARMAAQATREQRNAIADVIIDNSADRAALAAQVERLWDRLQRLRIRPAPGA
jgi:dephospho-CoA kinase